MSAPLTLGFMPYRLRIVLSPGAMFSQTIVAQSAWDAGVQIALHLVPARGTTQVWPAVVSGSGAVWAVPQPAVDAAIAARVQQARLYYTDPAGRPVLWGRGPVRVT